MPLIAQICFDREISTKTKMALQTCKGSSETAEFQMHLQLPSLKDTCLEICLLTHGTTFEVLLKAPAI